MRYSETWKPVGNCFDPISLECTDSQELSQIIANRTRESLAEREAETMNPWTQTEKDNALARCRIGLRAWRVKKPLLCLNAVTEDGHPLENEDESGRRLCDFGVRLSQHAPRARGITNSKTSYSMFRKLLTRSVGPLIEPSLTNSLP